MAPKKSAVKQKHDLFVDEYMVHLNVTKAYQDVYKCAYDVAKANGYRLFHDPLVSAEIERRMQARSKTLQFDEYVVIEIVKDTIDRCRQAVPVLDKLGRPATVKTSAGDVVALCTFDAQAVLKGAELLGRHRKMFTDKLETKVDPDSLKSADELAAEIRQLVAENGFHESEVKTDGKTQKA